MRVRKTLSLDEDTEEWIVRRTAITHETRGAVIYDAFKIASIVCNLDELRKIFPENHEFIRDTIIAHKDSLTEIPLPETFDG